MEQWEEDREGSQNIWITVAQQRFCSLFSVLCSASLDQLLACPQAQLCGSTFTGTFIGRADAITQLPFSPKKENVSPGKRARC